MSNATQTFNAATQYREVQRQVNAGDRIKIVAAMGARGRYRNGDELVVDRAVIGGAYVTCLVDGVRVQAGLHDSEYVVLEPIAPVAQVSTAALPDLFAQFIRDNAPAVRSYLAELEPVDNAGVNEPATPTLTRAKVIEMARERVAELERIGRDVRVKLPTGKFHDEFYGLKFRVNRERRTVVAEVMSRDGSFRKAKAYAKCAPDDVFNADIGKAIAAERALGLTLTDAFVNAPKTAEKVAGMSVNCFGRVYRLVATDDLVTDNCTATALSYTGQRGTIIDDTDAVYPQEGAKDGEAA